MELQVFVLRLLFPRRRLLLIGFHMNMSVIPDGDFLPMTNVDAGTNKKALLEWREDVFAPQGKLLCWNLPFWPSKRPDLAMPCALEKMRAHYAQEDGKEVAVHSVPCLQ